MGCLQWQRPCLDQWCGYTVAVLTTTLLWCFQWAERLLSFAYMGNVNVLHNKSQATFTSWSPHCLAPTVVNHTASPGSIDLICIKLLMQSFVIHGLLCMLVVPIMPMHLPLMTVNNSSSCYFTAENTFLQHLTEITQCKCNANDTFVSLQWWWALLFTAITVQSVRL